MGKDKWAVEVVVEVIVCALQQNVPWLLPLEGITILLLHSTPNTGFIFQKPSEQENPRITEENYLIETTPILAQSVPSSDYFTQTYRKNTLALLIFTVHDMPFGF